MYCVYVFMWLSICMHICVHVCGSQNSILAVFFHSPPYILRHDLSLNQELDDLARWLNKKPQGSIYPFPRFWSYRCTTVMPSPWKILSPLYLTNSHFSFFLCYPPPPANFPSPPLSLVFFLSLTAWPRSQNEIWSVCRTANFANWGLIFFSPSLGTFLPSQNPWVLPKALPRNWPTCHGRSHPAALHPWELQRRQIDNCNPQLAGISLAVLQLVRGNSYEINRPNRHFQKLTQKKSPKINQPAAFAMKLLPHHFLFFWKSRWADKSKMDQPHLPFLHTNYTPPTTSLSNTQWYSEAGLSRYFMLLCVI